MFPHWWRQPVRPTTYRPRVEALEGRLLPTTFLVTNINDSGPGSLRQAILDSNNDSTGTNTIDFSIGSGVQTIRPTSSLPIITQAVVLDGTTQPGLAGTPRIVLNGAAAGIATGLTIRAGNSTVRGLVINGFQHRGISLEGPGGGNLVAGNFLGTDVSGEASVANGQEGVATPGSNNNTIGGLTATDRNIISGNTLAGVGIFQNSSGNLVEGNYIGLDVTGNFALGNRQSGITLSDGAVNNTIGPGNVISGNANDGVMLTSATNSGNVVQGNFIGTDARGANKVPNAFSGLSISAGASNNRVVGDVISGNTGSGIAIVNPTTTGNVVQSNMIGTNPAGTRALPNGFEGLRIFGGAQGNTVGGTDPSARNLISGNTGRGVNLYDNGTTGNVVQGNYIGTDISGSVALGNGFNGLDIEGEASGNTVGGTDPGAGNLISGNLSAGIGIYGTGTANNVVQGNFIGTDASGGVALGNDTAGVNISDAAMNNTIGGTNPGAVNVIAGNGGDGVAIFRDSGTTGNIVQGNYIGTDVSGTVALGNFRGVSITNDATGNTLGGTAPGAGNLISGNTLEGVIFFNTAVGNAVLGNTIGLDINGNPLGNGASGVRVEGMSNNNTIGGAATGAANTIAANGYDGVLVNNSTGISILHNSIFSSTRLGIELGNNANHNQAFPVLTTATTDGTSTTIQGTLTSTPNTAFTLEFFANAVCNPSGFGEGQTYLGSTVATIDATGTMSFTVTLAVAVDPSMFVTATATSPTNDTSSFSQCLAVTASGSPSFPEADGDRAGIAGIFAIVRDLGRKPADREPVVQMNVEPRAWSSGNDAFWLTWRGRDLRGDGLPHVDAWAAAGTRSFELPFFASSDDDFALGRDPALFPDG